MVLFFNFVSPNGDHPQEEIAKFCYRSERKADIEKKSCHILANLPEHIV
jgi:hypothetical protein